MRIYLVVLPLFFLIGCDQATKQLAIEHLSGAERWVMAGDLFRLTYAENHGAFLGLGSQWPAWLRNFGFVGLACLLAAGAAFRVLAHGFSFRSASDWGWLFVVAGALGNAIDRVVHGGFVVDFMNVGIHSLRSGIFNVADLHIVAGLVLILFSSRRGQTTPCDQVGT